MPVPIHFGLFSLHWLWRPQLSPFPSPALSTKKGQVCTGWPPFPWLRFQGCDQWGWRMQGSRWLSQWPWSSSMWLLPSWTTTSRGRWKTFRTSTVEKWPFLNWKPLPNLKIWTKEEDQGGVGMTDECKGSLQRGCCWWGSILRVKENLVQRPQKSSTFH